MLHSSSFFLFWSFLGFERYEKKAGDLNEPMRYLPCALLQCAIWDYMAAFLSPFIIISYFRYYWNVTMRRRGVSPRRGEMGNDTASRCRFPIFYSRNFEVKNRRIEGHKKTWRIEFSSALGNHHYSTGLWWCVPYLSPDNEFLVAFSPTEIHTPTSCDNFCDAIFQL